MKRLYDGMTQLVAWAAGWGVRHETLLENCNENKTIAGVTPPCRLCVGQTYVSLASSLCWLVNILYIYIYTKLW